MAAGNNLRRGMKQVRDAVKQVAHEAAKDGDDRSHINVARRTNIKVARNIGHDGGTTHASATQDAPIIQNDTGMSERGNQ